jgi:hypothetical protein
MRRTRTTETPEVQVAVNGLPSTTADYVRQKVDALLGQVHEPVLFARVRVTRHGNPARERPVVAQANLDVNGRLVRTQVEAPTGTEAVDALEARLRSRLERVAEHALSGMPWRPPYAAPVRPEDGANWLAQRAHDLLGPAPAGRRNRIMVTLPSAAADDPDLLQRLVKRGMNLTRIN